MSLSSDYILLGNISGIHGVKGWVKVFSHTSPRVKITEYSQWFLQEKDECWKTVRLVDGKTQGKNIVALLEGVNDRNQAEVLVGMNIAILNEQLEKLPENQYYWRDLIGLLVKTTKGEPLGRIERLFDTGSNDVIIVKDKNQERMLPYIMGDVIKSIDLDKSMMVVDWDPEF